MSCRASHRRLSVPDLEAILAVTSKLAAPFDLMTMLAEVVNAAKQVLHADRSSVWLYDPAADELVLEIATGIAPVRVPASAGMAPARATARSSTSPIAMPMRASIATWTRLPAIERAACWPCRSSTARASW
jgi:hypothetical protein